eukprot:gene2180-biopygen1952
MVIPAKYAQIECALIDFFLVLVLVFNLNLPNKEKNPDNYFREKLMLYLPWRNEEKDLIQHSQTFEEHYEKTKLIVDKNSYQYEQYSATLQQVAEGLEFDEVGENCIVAPNAQHIDNADSHAGTQASKLYGCFDPQTAIQSQNDLLDDAGVYPRSENSIIESKAISDLELRENVQLLNKEQIEFFYHVLHLVKTKNLPMRLFLSGGAGVGKSFVLNTLYEALNKFLNQLPGERAIIQAIDLVIGDLAEDVKENTSWQVQVAFLIHQPKDTSINALTSNAIDITLSQLPKLKANQKVNVTVTCSFGEEPPKNVLIQRFNRVVAVKEDIIAEDPTLTASLREPLIEKLESGKTYELKNLNVKVFKGTTHLATSTETTFKEVNQQVPVIKGCDLLAHPERQATLQVEVGKDEEKETILLSAFTEVIQALLSKSDATLESETDCIEDALLDMQNITIFFNPAKQVVTKVVSVSDVVIADVADVAAQ